MEYINKLGLIKDKEQWLVKKFKINGMLIRRTGKSEFYILTKKISEFLYLKGYPF
jgi:hypothetical protein